MKKQNQTEKQKTELGKQDTEAIRNKIRDDIQVINQKLAGYKQIRKIKFRAVEFDKTTTKKLRRVYNK